MSRKSKKLQICCFCGLSEDNESEYGKFYEHDGIATHYYCLLLSSNMEQKGKDDEGILGFLTADIKREVRRGLRLLCVHCKKRGATLGCCNIKCKQIFHYPCGKRAGSLNQFFGEFRSFCRQHRPKQKIDEHVKEQLEKNENVLCYICYEEVNPYDIVKTLWAPCCKKNAWFHRKCVQQLANSAGYFFKCPLCNNKKEFQKAMQESGIFIPSQDASWELVPNAYQELMYRHDQCDAPVCLCPKGRKYTSSNAKWELALCRTCGSQGIHMACGQLKWARPNWECAECTSILFKSRQSTSTVDIDLEDTILDAADSDSDISVGMDLPVTCSNNIPDHISVSSSSCESVHSVVTNTSSSSKPAEYSTSCIPEDSVHSKEHRASMRADYSDRRRRNNRFSRSSKISSATLISDDDEDDVIIVGSVENGVIINTKEASLKNDQVSDTDEQHKTQFVDDLKVDSSDEENGDVIDRLKATRNLDSDRDGEHLMDEPDSPENSLNIKISNLRSLTAETFIGIGERESMPSHSDSSSLRLSECKSACNKTPPLSRVSKENIALKIKRKPDNTHFSDKTTKKMKGDDVNDMLTDKAAPLKDTTSNQILQRTTSHVQLQENPTKNFQRESKSDSYIQDNSCTSYETSRHETNSTPSDSIMTPLSRRKCVRSPVHPKTATTEDAAVTAEPSSSESLANHNDSHEISKRAGECLDDASISIQRCKRRSCVAVVVPENNNASANVEKTPCNKTLEEPVYKLSNIHKEEDNRIDASCIEKGNVDFSECSGKRECGTTPTCGKVTHLKKQHHNNCSSTKETKVEGPEETERSTLVDLFNEINVPDSACNRSRLIPEYVNLRDLKFRVDDTNNLQIMLLINEYSLKMNIDTARKVCKVGCFLSNDNCGKV